MNYREWRSAVDTGIADSSPVSRPKFRVFEKCHGYLIGCAYRVSIQVWRSEPRTYTHAVLEEEDVRRVIEAVPDKSQGTGCHIRFRRHDQILDRLCWPSCLFQRWRVSVTFSEKPHIEAASLIGHLV